MFNKNYKIGFTLAEVLITLTILGVVAALVIPNVYQKYQRRVTVVKVKKMYSVLVSANDQYLATHNNVSKKFPLTEQGATDAFNEYIRPYFAITYDAGTSKANKTKIMKDELTKALDGSNYSKKNTYVSNSEYYAAKLKDGSVIWVRGVADDAKYNAIFFYHVNNNFAKNNSNIYGKNLFAFYINDMGVTPFSSDSFDYKSWFETYCIPTNGLGCTAWIIAKGNMDYLDCLDTLTWEKNKCD